MLRLFVLLLGVTWASAQVQVRTLPCSSGTAAPQNERLNFETVFAQWDTGQTSQGHLPSSKRNSSLQIVGLGNVETQSTGYSSVTGFLATIVTTASILSYDQFSNNSALCQSILSENSTQGCPYGPGAFALGLTIPFSDSYPLTTLTTRIRILDTSSPSLELACIDIPTTPYYKHYFPYPLFLWFSVGLVLLWIAVVSAARIWAAHTASVLNREAELASSLTARLTPHSLREQLGPIFWDAASGAALQTSATLRRFATPCVRDVVWVIQYAAMLSMVAVRWPDFAYPIFTRAAWSMLAYNVTLAQSDGRQIDPLTPVITNAPAPGFASQMSDPTSPIYFDPNLPNNLLDLRNSKSGLESFATTLGLHAADLWGNAAAIFLIILGAALLASFVLLGIDYLSWTISGRSPRYSSPNGKLSHRHQGGSVVNGPAKDLDASTIGGVTDEHFYDSGEDAPPQPGPALTSWWQTDGSTPEPDRVDFQKHARLAVANCIRVLLLFHLPLIIYSVYQMSLLHNGASTASFVLALLFFAVIAVILPAFLVFKISRRSVPELQEDLYTLVTYGPLYNIYGGRSYGFVGFRFAVNLVLGIAVGAGQDSGLAQAIVILLVEVIEVLATSLWLPWGVGAMMGPLAFIFCIARIVSAVLLVVLTAQVGVSAHAAAWIAYVVLVIQAAVIALLFFVLVTKAIELAVRALGNVPFDEAHSARAGGLGGALRRWDRSGKRRQRHARRYAARRDRRSKTSQQLERHNSMQSFADMDNFRYPASPHTEEEGYLMSTIPPAAGSWGHRSSLSDFTIGQSIAPGSYAAHQRSTSYQEAPVDSASSSGFKVVRGGRATDTSPYTMNLPPGAAGSARAPLERMQDPRATGSVEVIPHAGRPRARSFTADIEFVAPAPAPHPSSAPRTADLFSNPLPMAGSSTANAAQSSKKGKKSGILGTFGRRNTKGELDSDDDSTDSDDSDAPGEQRRPLRSLWPFGKKQHAEEEEEAPPQEHSFSVVRRPPPRASTTEFGQAI